MKIKLFLLSFLFLFPALASAQVTVVRVKNNQVYLDTSSLETTVHTGDVFKVILSSEKLTNPKTGKDLGLLYNYSPEGNITEVQPLYAVGKLPSVAGVQVGQEAVITQQLQIPAPTTSAGTPATTTSSSTHQKTVFEPVNQEIISLSTADVTQPGADNLITLSDKGLITVWARNGEKLEEKLSYKIPSGTKPLTLSAAPLRQAETAEIFVTVYDEQHARISTLVLAHENGHWVTLDTLPYFVKEIGCGKEKTIWMQKPFIAGAYPGNARKLVYEDGHFKGDKQVVSSRRSWLTGINFFRPDETAPAQLIYTSPYGRIKMETANGKTTENKDVPVGAPNRVKYKQEIVKFYPSLQVINAPDKPVLVAVENIAKLGMLSDLFGHYDNAKLHFISFDKGRLTRTDTVNLDGFVYDTACRQNSVLAAEVLPDGQSAVVEIFN
ncbi:MAG: hypothetical protein MJ053_01125 [Elusimicrobiaceae bacterium]|nr:hypothetical protein [Elusimicrobiaceae bacterium]